MANFARFPPLLSLYIYQIEYFFKHTIVDSTPIRRQFFVFIESQCTRKTVCPFQIYSEILCSLHNKSGQWSMLASLAAVGHLEDNMCALIAGVNFLFFVSERTPRYGVTFNRGPCFRRVLSHRLQAKIQADFMELNIRRSNFPASTQRWMLWPRVIEEVECVKCIVLGYCFEIEYIYIYIFINL